MAGRSGGCNQHPKILGQLLTHTWTGLSVLHQADLGSTCPGLESTHPLSPCVFLSMPWLGTHSKATCS